MKESDILYQVGPYWVAKDHGDYFCYKDVGSYAESFCRFVGSDNGFSKAKAYCDYKIKRDNRMIELSKFNEISTDRQMSMSERQAQESK